jgi:hypothetical protein
MNTIELLNNKTINQVRGNPMRTNLNTYGFVSTKETLEVFKQHGWYVTAFKETKAKNTEDQGYQKHLIRLSHPTLSDAFGNGDRLEIVVMNSHNGDSALRLMVGIFRLVCSNGLVLNKGTASELRVIHSKNFIRDLNSRLEEFAANIPKVVERINKFKTIEINAEDYRVLQQDTALYALRKVKFDSVRLDTLGRAKRIADTSNDAWTVGNRLQEYLIKGGIQYQITDKYGSPQWRTTRGVSSIIESVKRNQFIWDKIGQLVG